MCLRCIRTWKRPLYHRTCVCMYYLMLPMKCTQFFWQSLSIDSQHTAYFSFLTAHITLTHSGYHDHIIYHLYELTHCQSTGQLTSILYSHLHYSYFCITSIFNGKLILIHSLFYLYLPNTNIPDADIDDLGRINIWCFIF